MTAEGRPWTVAEFAEYLGLSKGYVYRQCAARAWPHSRAGRAIRFFADDRTAVEALLKEPAIRTPAPLALVLAGVRNRAA